MPARRTGSIVWPVSEAPGLLFDAVAEDYDRVRSGYPGELVDAACRRGGLERGSAVVEVGCGTGKLTVSLAERGLSVDAVDPGKRLVEIARARVGARAVRFHVGTFEAVDLPAGAFEALFSATAFHWVDPAVGWAKAARLLRPGGLLALLTHVPTGSAFDAEFLAAWRQVIPEAAEWAPHEAETLVEEAETRRGDVTELWSWLTKRELRSRDAAKLFGDVRIEAVSSEREETAARSIALTRTTSMYLRLDHARRRRLEELLGAAFERVGGSIQVTLLTTLVTARTRV